MRKCEKVYNFQAWVIKIYFYATIFSVASFSYVKLNLFSGNASQDNLAEIFIRNLLNKSYRGRYYIEGYQIEQKRLAETNESDDSGAEGAGSEVDASENESDDNDEEEEFIFVNVSAKEFNRHAVANIVIENEFFEKKFEWVSFNLMLMAINDAIYIEYIFL